jgi:hypothetical protein
MISPCGLCVLCVSCGEQSGRSTYHKGTENKEAAQRIRGGGALTQREVSDLGSDPQAGYDRVAEQYASEYFEESRAQAF